MATSDMLSMVDALGSGDKIRVDHEQEYITTTDLELMKPNGFEVDRILHQNTVFKISEAPEEYHSTLEALVRSKCVEVYDSSVLTISPPKELEEGIEKVESTKTFHEGILLEEGEAIVKIPSFLDGESAPKKTVTPEKKPRSEKLEKLKARIKNGKRSSK